MKGFIACMLAAVPHFLAQPLAQPLHLAISYDEEVGCLGVRTAGCAGQSPGKARSLPDRRAYRTAAGARSQGKLAVRCEVQGAACHSAYAPQGVNAINMPRS